MGTVYSAPEMGSGAFHQDGSLLSSLERVYKNLQSYQPIDVEDLCIVEICIKTFENRTDFVQKKLQDIKILLLQDPKNKDFDDLNTLTALFSDAIVIAEDAPRKVISIEANAAMEAQLKQEEIFHHWCPLRAEELQLPAGYLLSFLAENQKSELNPAPPPAAAQIEDGGEIPQLMLAALGEEEDIDPKKEGFVVLEKKNPETYDLALHPQRQIIARQTHLLTLCGWRFFQDYLQPMMPDIVISVSGLLKQPAFAAEIGTLLAQSLLPAPPPNAAKEKDAKPVPLAAEKAPQKSTKFLQYALLDQLKALQTTLKRTLTDEQMRKEFAELVFDMLARMSPEPFSSTQKEILICILGLYVPDMLHGALSACLTQPNEEEALPPWMEPLFQWYQAAQSGSQQEKLMSLCCFMIEKQLSLPLEKASEALLIRLSDAAIIDKLIDKIRTPLINLMYTTETGNSSAKLRQIILDIFEHVLACVRSINAASKKYPDNDEAIVSDILITLLTKDVRDPGTEKQRIELFQQSLKKLIENLVWKLFFPKTLVPAENAPPIQKLVARVLSTVGFALEEHLLTSHNLNRLIGRLLNQPLSFENPFEGPTAALDFFNADDEVFSKKIDECIHDICAQILEIKFGTGLLSAAGRTLLNLIPALGVKMQKGLNRLFNSEVTLLPNLILTQLFYEIPWSKPPAKNSKLSPELQKKEYDIYLQNQYYRALEKPKMPFKVKSLVQPSVQEIQQTKSNVEKDILTDPKRIEAILAEMLPFGTRDAALDLIQKLYKIGRHELFIKIMFTYVMLGAYKGLSYVDKPVQAPAVK